MIVRRDLFQAISSKRPLPSGLFQAALIGATAMVHPELATAGGEWERGL